MEEGSVESLLSGTIVDGSNDVVVLVQKVCCRLNFCLQRWFVELDTTLYL